MNEFLIFLTKASLAILLLYGWYAIALQKLTFFKVNRSLLNLIIPISVLLGTYSFSAFTPLVDFKIGSILPFNDLPQAVTGGPSNTFVPTESGFDVLALLFTIYTIGLIASLLRSAWSLKRIHSLSKTGDSKRQGPITLCASQDIQSPFSFLHYVFLPLNLPAKDLPVVLAHEEVHFREKHSLDLLLHQVGSAIFWFHPMVYMMEKSIKLNHEFLADQGVLKSSIQLSTYLSSLTDMAILSKKLAMINSFKQPNFKTRINMIAQQKTPKARRFLYLSLVPMLFTLVFAFAKGDGNDVPSIKPVNSKEVTSGFGNRLDPTTKTERLHRGVDYRAPLGTAVFATANGVVTTASEEGNWGNLVIIKHGQGFQTRYAHLQAFKVKVGDRVKIGQQIATVGNSGRSLGPHLHYEIEKDGKLLDPEAYLKEKE